MVHGLRVGGRSCYGYGLSLGGCYCRMPPFSSIRPTYEGRRHSGRYGWRTYRYCYSSRHLPAVHTRSLYSAS